MTETFRNEKEFEDALVNVLANDYGWKDGVLNHPTEQDLIDNWANILFENNKGIDRLNGEPLTEGEMQQILEQIKALRTPMMLNGFVNGKTVSIVRDNKADALHFGHEISLRIFDRQEIAGGRSRYQIARQPHFETKTNLLSERRGDVMLLINGMPLIHIELKRNNIPISQAREQIRKYSHEGVFSGIFSLVQIFVAMSPEETVYFANPGKDGDFETFNFHWGDFNNEPINYWKDIARDLLSIPMAHQLIGFYTVADGKDNTLKVMRSYQYYAASNISRRVKESKWNKDYSRGGHIWHTTGSGKTMTSFKSAQLIASSKDADKVVFLVDRIELGTQSLDEYRNFANDSESVQATEDTDVLRTKLKSEDPSNTLIVTSIQKMSNIGDDGRTKEVDLERIREKHIVFIVDECHRSTFGEMMQTIRNTFPNAMFFGFTGTPIEEDNQKQKNTTADVFGDELHRYSIADGIRDHNVLGFDPYKVLTFQDKELKENVALEAAKAHSVAEAINNRAKKSVYLYYSKLPMPRNPLNQEGKPLLDENGKEIHGIEYYIPKSQYSGTDGEGNPEHLYQVVKDIGENWTVSSVGGRFHAILATSSISEAIHYYHIFKEKYSHLKVTSLFDSTIDNNEGAIYKEDGLIEIIADYNTMFKTEFNLSKHAAFKRDVAARLAHKKPYFGIENTPESQLDILIVVDQMLTGFDSKWINTLYLDKELHFEHLIQAFSRTNRILDHEKPYGIIRYYRYPHSMDINVEQAVKLYSGDRPASLFVPKLEQNLKSINIRFEEIQNLFKNAGVENFNKLPNAEAECKEFAKLFKELTDYLEAAKIQGFTWGKLSYEFKDKEETSSVTVAISEKTYLILALRYKELIHPKAGPGPDMPFDIHGYLTTIDTGHIDNDYLNHNFEKWLKGFRDSEVSEEEVQHLLTSLHSSFAALNQEQQRYAELVINAIQSFDLEIKPSTSFIDYINEYQIKEKEEQIKSLISMIGVDESKLRKLLAQHVTDANIDEFGRFEELKNSCNIDLYKEYFNNLFKDNLPIYKVKMELDKLLRKFILSGGFNLGEYSVSE